MKKNEDNKKTEKTPCRGFLPMSQEEVRALGWDRPDFVYVIGDAYVDHSSFGPAVIGRTLEARGYRVAIISQPDWTDENSVCVFGEPRLGFLVSAGNMDSMVNRYTVNKKTRSQDAYSPGGKTGKRPNYATIVYCNLIKRKFRHSPVIIGGIEASLRRLGHYDYWSDSMKRSILLDSGADIISYGMGELSVPAIADALASGTPINEITSVPGTVYKTRDVSDIKGIMLPEFDEIAADRRKYAESFAIQYENTDFANAKKLIEKYGENRYVVQNPPSRPLTTAELDAVYELPYKNTWHPSYDAEGGVPALAEIKFSLSSCRGCFGGCSFCALTFHQGRIVQARSRESLVREAEKMTKDPEFKGYINDVGGPTANFRRPACDKQMKKGACPNKQCLFPKPCPNLKADHSDYISVLRALREIPGVRKVFIRSGIRFDYILADKKTDFLTELCRYHISGQLRVAPEHVSDNVLNLMGKPRNSVYKEFCEKFDRINGKIGKKQYVVPYLMSSHPGSSLEDAVKLAEAVRDMGYMPEQVQDFYPTPSTVSTVMYATGLDPRTMEPVYIPKSPHEKAMQRALIQYKLPENYELVKEALIKTGRTDLIGFDRNCLIPPRKIAGAGKHSETSGKNQEDAGKKGGRSASGASSGRSNAPKNSVKRQADNREKQRSMSENINSGNARGTERSGDKKRKKHGR
ncbi:MAG: YgiQ family radical SAM protein [Clostridia bacterium]|nr:YgiQ family radical SAM protein [Clostridia bacterium]